MSGESERIESALAASEPVRAAREALEEDAERVWIVGGAVRDALLGEPIGDVDLAVAGDPAEVARRIANHASGPRFELSREHETWRAQGGGAEERGGGGVWEVDVAALRGGSIEADLLLRDFTINSIAMPLTGGDPVDPSGGIADAAARRLEPTGERALREDPLRLLRAPRLAAAYELEIGAEAADAIRAEAPLAERPAGERRFAELRRIMAGPDPLRALELMAELGLTEVVLPELAELRGVEQSANHHLDVYEHTIEVLRRWLAVEQDLGRYAGDDAPAVEAKLAEPLADELTRRDAIRFAALLHDVGKPATRTERDGFVGFRGHDVVGAEMITELCRRLRTSRRLGEYLAALARHHLILGFMTHERPLPRRRIWDYISATRPVSLDVTLLTIADRLSAQGSGVPEQAIEAHLELSREMIAEIVALDREGQPPPLLDGGEIAAVLGLEGPRIGEAVRELEAAQFAGEIGDREAALAHLREWIRADPAGSGDG